MSVLQLTLKRIHYSETATIGELFVNGEFECYTLEDKVRDIKTAADKVYSKTAIPAGTYKIINNVSTRFRRVLPLLLNVPYFEGVRIHPGNTSKDTEGCILVGLTKQEPDFIGQSRVAFEALFNKLTAWKGDIEITIQNK